MNASLAVFGLVLLAACIVHGAYEADDDPAKYERISDELEANSRPYLVKQMQPGVIYQSNDDVVQVKETSRPLPARFQFKCTCSAKVTPSKTVTVPPSSITNSSMAAIVALQQRLKELEEVLLRQQQIIDRSANGQQFASLLSMAQLMDCQCNGESFDEPLASIPSTVRTTASSSTPPPPPQTTTAAYYTTAATTTARPSTATATTAPQNQVSTPPPVAHFTLRPSFPFFGGGIPQQRIPMPIPSDDDGSPMMFPQFGNPFGAGRFSAPASPPNFMAPQNGAQFPPRMMGAPFQTRMNPLVDYSMPFQQKA